MSDIERHEFSNTGTFEQVIEVVKAVTPIVGPVVAAVVTERLKHRGQRETPKAADPE
jgi:hypothetical protein